MELSNAERPTTLVVFGVTGDLSRRYLIPALSQIKEAGLLPKRFNILAVSRRSIDPADILGASAANLAQVTRALQMDTDNPASFQVLRQNLSRKSNHQIIFYLAVPPSAVSDIIRNLAAAGLNTADTKLLLEKPFGSDYYSAKRLIAQTRRHFKENQIYRIDHYLAKEVAQNIAVFIGSNVLFRRVWDRRFIDNIVITASEKTAVEGRANFYEQTGTLRDVIQSHLLQLAALTLMEPCPHDYNFADLPLRRAAALRHIHVASGKLSTNAIRGQYIGYKTEVNSSRSTTETFGAIRLASKDRRWHGVPIYLQSGKALNTKLTQIAINFKSDREGEANVLNLRIQPRESIELELWVKAPGYEKSLQKLTHSFSYAHNFSDRLPEAYEQIIVDVLRGSRSLFASSTEVLESWRILEPIQKLWASGKPALRSYKKGSTIEQVLR